MNVNIVRNLCQKRSLIRSHTRRDVCQTCFTTSSQIKGHITQRRNHINVSFDQKSSPQAASSKDTSEITPRRTPINVSIVRRCLQTGNIKRCIRIHTKEKSYQNYVSIIYKKYFTTSNYTPRHIRYHVSIVRRGLQLGVT